MPRASSLSWWWAEVRVRRKLETELSRHLELAERCEELAFEAIKAFPANGLGTAIVHAHSALTARSLTDLRAATLLATLGYTMQSWAVAASCFEAAHAIGYIGRNEERANTWLNHKELSRPPWGAKDSVQNAVIFLEIANNTKKRQELVDREYKLYENLCVAKHVNPIAEKFRYFYRRNSNQILRFTPVSTKARAREAKRGLLLAIRSVTTGLWALLEAHHSTDEGLKKKLVVLMQEADALLPDTLSEEAGNRRAPLAGV